LQNVIFGLASEMLLFSFLLASSLCVLVDRRVAIRLHLLLMLSTLELRRLLIFLANVLSIPQGFQTLRATCLWQSAKRRWLWIKPANLAVL
jgi:hypothetical protein